MGTHQEGKKNITCASKNQGGTASCEENRGEYRRSHFQYKQQFFPFPDTSPWQRVNSALIPLVHKPLGSDA